VEFDPTNGLVGNRDLIRVAVARDPAQALPLSGTWTGSQTDYLGMDINVDVTAEEPPKFKSRRVVGLR
jgi:transglutaminase-like putative cysteine protease